MRWRIYRSISQREFNGALGGTAVALLNCMARRRTRREFAGAPDAKSRTVRPMRTVAHEMERLGVRWSAEDDDSVAYFDWANWMTVSPNDSDYEAVSLKARGVEGCLLVHRALALK